VVFAERAAELLEMGLLVNAPQIKALVVWWAERVWGSQKKMGEFVDRPVNFVTTPY
jgi:hypothetical protein